MTTPKLRDRTASVAALAAALMLSACDRTPPAPVDSTGAAAGVATDTGTVSYDTTRVSRDRQGEVNVLDDVSIDGARNSITFTFRKHELPGIDVGYTTEPITRCGSGDSASVRGAAFLTVRMSPVDAHVFEGEKASVTIAERDRLLPGPLFSQAVLTCDFEAQVEWAFGLLQRAPFRLIDSASVGKYIVEFQHQH